MKHFTFEAHIPRTVYGSGTLAKLPEEVDRFKAQRTLIVTENTPRTLALADKVSALLNGKTVQVCAEAVMHTPEDVTLKSMEQTKSLDPELVVSLGGGSTIGLGKALTIRMGIPHLVVPTTYAGSEATPILGETVNSVKTTRTDPKILPDTIIYDVDLTLTLPQQLTYTSGINAIAHCVEALYSTQINPIIESIAVSGIDSMTNALRRLKTAPNDLDARGEATLGAWSAGICLGHVGMALHHKLCHTLGGTFNLPHSETHTVILPHAMAYNAKAAPDAMGKIQTAMKADVSAPRAVWELQKELGTVMSLRQLGLKDDDLPKVVELAMKAQYPNPAPLVEGDLLALLQNAYHGVCPK